MSTQPDPAVILANRSPPGRRSGRLPSDQLPQPAQARRPARSAPTTRKSKCKACGNHITTAHVTTSATSATGRDRPAVAGRPDS